MQETPKLEDKQDEAEDSYEKLLKEMMKLDEGAPPPLPVAKPALPFAANTVGSLFA